MPYHRHNIDSHYMLNDNEPSIDPCEIPLNHIKLKLYLNFHIWQVLPTPRCKAVLAKSLKVMENDWCHNTLLTTGHMIKIHYITWIWWI